MMQMRGGIEVKVAQVTERRTVVVDGSTYEVTGISTRFEALDLLEVLKRRGTVRQDATL